MSGPHTASRRTSTQRRQSDDLDETAPLLLTRTRSPEINVAEGFAIPQDPPEEFKPTPADNVADPAATTWSHSVRYLVMLCAFLTSLSFGVTQVPLLYVFRLMTCDAYYESHHSQQVPTSNEHFSRLRATASIISYITEPTIYLSDATNIESDPDRCSIHAIESSTALYISLLGASTTVFGIMNLFLTGSLIKRIGVKTTLIIQVFIPAVRLLIQNIGVEVWGTVGMVIIQCSQVVTPLGGPSGYLLVLNTFMTEIVEYEGRTAALGRLAGSMMFGSALGFLLGGVIADVFGMKAPFRLTFVLFLCSCAYVAIFLPYVPNAEPKTTDTGSILGKKKKSIAAKFLGPLTTFTPKKFIGRDGVIRTEYGAFLLAWGVFLAILATGYLPTLLQLYSTDVFGFDTKQNGWLIFMYSLLRGVFLTFAFPKLIAIGRKLTTKKEGHASKAQSVEDSQSSEREPLLPSQSHQPPAPSKTSTNDKNPAPKKEQTFTFDLTYTRLSLLADGLLTLLCTFVRHGWQMYLVAAILPFSAGTGSASKGTILQMVGSTASSGERTDALAGVSLVENIARLSTTFVLGLVFAGFADIGRTELVFVVNAAIALVGFGVLLFARFPLEGSRRLDQVDVDEEEIVEVAAAAAAS